MSDYQSSFYRINFELYLEGSRWRMIGATCGMLYGGLLAVNSIALAWYTIKNQYDLFWPTLFFSTSAGGIHLTYLSYKKISSNLGYMGRKRFLSCCGVIAGAINCAIGISIATLHFWESWPIPFIHITAIGTYTTKYSLNKLSSTFRSDNKSEFGAYCGILYGGVLTLASTASLGYGKHCNFGWLYSLTCVSFGALGFQLTQRSFKKITSLQVYNIIR
ncbi:hypothetical protein CEXT_524791 [Caerostris extrusa]|uniref:Uncharacterized protein n=1 Tax=Caerostris extrusa TaxID=172846 RepID=A0AAV4Y720_CAEEX|nr:hypothetical protein CEXT_524791 [Caerostris extrusa]